MLISSLVPFAGTNQIRFNGSRINGLSLFGTPTSKIDYKQMFWRNQVVNEKTTL
ncbi:hypothetical protein SAMN04488136_1194 [Vibrio xiamenensis]|uniref:Uncharacterized protein n=1 Tax=Vibrio xiamenensis TaxID=861298 RepID=A0A1G8D998_9VIBR|nr:hypothetical protein SAMN04488136_1194 [Vibrio xiamenensis]